MPFGNGDSGGTKVLLQVASGQRAETWDEIGVVKVAGKWSCRCGGKLVNGEHCFENMGVTGVKTHTTGKSNSPIKSKLKDTGKCNSPKSRWVPISERVFSQQLVTQYNPITDEVRKEIKKSAVSDESNMSAVVTPVIDNVPVATETDKETEPVVAAIEIADKVDVVVKKCVKASSLVVDKFDVVKDKVDVVADKASDTL
nr:hypothetical protein [Tanacetum cinerariifolium]